MKTCTTKEEWTALLQESPLPLSKCPRDVLDNFTAQLKFQNGGCAHGVYKDLKDHLQEEDFFTVFAALGISRQRFDSIKDAVCTTENYQSSCVSQWGSFCDPTFCHH